MRIFLLVLLLLSVGTPIFAHTTGVSLEKKVGAYTIDVGYDPASPQVDDRIVFDFAFKNADGARAMFDSVWVRMTQNSKTVLATGIAHAKVGGTTLVWLPARDGPLTLAVRYERAGEPLAEAAFDIPIAPKEESGYAWYGIALVIALSGGAIIWYVKKR
ncbi:hypothetical protein EBR66_06240 [bacterium]|nr:hypothetical protein [bacterium]